MDIKERPHSKQRPSCLSEKYDRCVEGRSCLSGGGEVLSAEDGRAELRHSPKVSLVVMAELEFGPRSLGSKAAVHTVPPCHPIVRGGTK